MADSALNRDRAIMLCGLAGLSALAWAYLLYAGAGMMEMDFTLTLGIWAVMMIAMMTPSATPTLLMFAAIHRQRRQQARPLTPTALFLAGYLLAWMGFSLLAALAQWGLHTASFFTSAAPAGALLMAAGIFQWTPLKHTCLTHCRSPQGFFMTEWREGALGALRMGLKHGQYCVGCCWLLMTILFVVGVMNLLWMAVIAAFILIEKIAPFGPWVGRLAGLLLLSTGIWLALS